MPRKFLRSSVASRTFYYLFPVSPKHFNHISSEPSRVDTSDPLGNRPVAIFDGNKAFKPPAEAERPECSSAQFIYMCIYHFLFFPEDCNRPLDKAEFWNVQMSQGRLGAEVSCLDLALTKRVRIVNSRFSRFSESRGRISTGASFRMQ